MASYLRHITELTELVFILDRARYTICSENEVCFRSPYCGEVKSLNES